VPAHIGKKWEALVEADQRNSLSPVDLSLLVLRSIADGCHEESALVIRLQEISHCQNTSRLRVCDSLAKLVEEGFIEEQVEVPSDHGKIRRFELTAAGRVIIEENS
jgi:DNA-binding PadR family transcriptional regulator